MAEGKKRRLIIIGTLAAVAFVIVAMLFYRYSSARESTDDAFIDGHIIQLAAKVPGEVLAVHAQDNQAVKQGDALAEIDPRDYQVKIDEQRAKAAAAQAEAHRAAADAKRYEEIFKNDEISKQQLENAQATAMSAQATYQKEKAALDQDALNLSYTKIIAPADGRVTQKSVEVGNYVQVGQTMLSLVPEQVWITANYKETQLTHMQPGQRVKIKIDAYPSKVFDGHVDSIQSGTGQRFSVMPPENATGNYVKVVQRVPVKILIDTPPDPAYRLSPGMSAEPTVRVK